MTRDDITQWIDVIHSDVRDAFIQDNLFWQFQDVIHQNERLVESHNVFLYWVNTLFKDSIIMAVRRQLDGHRDCISLLRLLRELHADPALMAGRFSADEIQEDIDNLESFRTVRGFADRRVAHTDRQDLSDGHPTFHDVRHCIEQFCAIVNKYAAALPDHGLSALPPACGTGWKEIFTYRWLQKDVSL